MKQTLSNRLSCVHVFCDHDDIYVLSSNALDSTQLLWDITNKYLKKTIKKPLKYATDNFSGLAALYRGRHIWTTPLPQLLKKFLMWPTSINKESQKPLINCYKKTLSNIPYYGEILFRSTNIISHGGSVGLIRSRKCSVTLILIVHPQFNFSCDCS